MHMSCVKLTECKNVLLILIFNSANDNNSFYLICFSLHQIYKWVYIQSKRGTDQSILPPGNQPNGQNSPRPHTSMATNGRMNLLRPRRRRHRLVSLGAVTSWAEVRQGQTRSDATANWKPTELRQSYMHTSACKRNEVSSCGTNAVIHKQTNKQTRSWMGVWRGLVFHGSWDEMMSCSQCDQTEWDLVCLSVCLSSRCLDL